MCVKDFPLEDCTDQIDWAIDIMQNMQADIDAKKEEGKQLCFRDILLIKF